MPVNQAGLLIRGVAALVLGLLAPLGGSVVGEWTGRAEDGQEERIALRADGKGTLDDTRIEWRISGDSLLVRFEGIPIEARYFFRVEGDQLWLRDDDGESRQYRRTGGATGGPAGGAAPGPGGSSGAGASASGGTSTGGAAGAGSSGGSSAGASAGSAGASSGAQVYSSPRGFELDLPAGWRAVPAENGAAALVPPDFRQGLEVFGVEGRSSGTAGSLSSDEVLAFFDAQARQASPLLARKGGPEALGGGAIRLVYEGTTAQGAPLKGLILARSLGKEGVYIAGAAEPARLDALAPLLRRAFDSIRASAPSTGAAAPGAAGAPDDASWLVGMWSKGEKTGSLSTESTDAWFNADGTFEYRWIKNTAQSGGGGNFYSNTISRAGRYSLRGGVLTIDFDPARTRAEWPPPEGSIHAQPRWEFPVQRGVDPKTGKEAIISNGEVVVVRER